MVIVVDICYCVISHSKTYWFKMTAIYSFTILELAFWAEFS